jgi:hypothetical protein
MENLQRFSGSSMRDIQRHIDGANLISDLQGLGHALIQDH